MITLLKLLFSGTPKPQPRNTYKVKKLNIIHTVHPINFYKKYMTKQEAIKAMSEGKKVTHRHFSSNEWVTIDGNQILLEDGVKCSTYEFWKWRTDPSWDSDWDIFDQTFQVSSGLPR